MKDALSSIWGASGVQQKPINQNATLDFLGQFPYCHTNQGRQKHVCVAEIEHDE